MPTADRAPRHNTQATDRQANALRLYIDGHTYQQIADQLGYADASGAWRSVNTALDRRKEQILTDSDHILNTHRDRLTDLYRRCITELDNANEEGREVGKAQLITAARGALDSLAKVNGLDQLAATVTVRTESALEQNLAKLAEYLTHADTD